MLYFIGSPIGFVKNTWGLFSERSKEAVVVCAMTQEFSFVNA